VLGRLAWLADELPRPPLRRKVRQRVSYGPGLCADEGDRGATTEAPPSFYIRRQIACTFMDDPVAIRNRDITGLDCLMWGNDYPHQEGVFPDSQEWVDKQFDGVPESEIMHIVHDNAARTFGLTV
jgi:hypothetical protein